MTVKGQFAKIKENWLIIVLVVVLLGVFMFGGNLGGVSYQSYGKVGGALGAMESMEMDMAMAPGGYGRVSSYYGNDDFAPEVEERKITKTASLSTEVERGDFKDEEAKLKAIVTASDSFILNENVNKYGEKWKAYYRGTYQLKIETGKYDSVITQLKEIGEVQSFNENAADVTGRYTDLEDDLEVEKERLQRYKAMYAEAERIEDKINLNDRIANQERRIKYIEDAINNIDKRVDYSTVSVTITEEQSGFMQLKFVKVSQLLTKFVNSLRSLLVFIFSVLPWAIAAGIVWLIVKVFRKKKR